MGVWQTVLQGDAIPLGGAVVAYHVGGELGGHPVERLAAAPRGAATLQLSATAFLAEPLTCTPPANVWGTLRCPAHGTALVDAAHAGADRRTRWPRRRPLAAAHPLRDARTRCCTACNLALNPAGHRGSTAPFVGLPRYRLGHLPRAHRHRRDGAGFRIEQVSGPVGGLVMTAAGLAVAIPAVLAYNVLGAGSPAASGPNWKASPATCAELLLHQEKP